MDIKEYISSGIIESYVLGLASPEEMAEFEKLCREYPELLAARTNFEIALEKQMENQVIVPPAGIKEKVMNTIRQQSSINQTKIISMEKSGTPRQSNWLRFAAAASVILLLGSAYFAYTFYSENKKLKNSAGNMQAQLDSARIILDRLALEQKIMSDPNVTVVSLVGTEKKSSANVYWDSTSSDVYLVIKNMPKLPSDKQYQLWALINGKPADLGLFDGDKEKVILKMKNTKNADAFAITIENRGNTGGPSLEQLQSIGKPDL